MRRGLYAERTICGVDGIYPPSTFPFDDGRESCSGTDRLLPDAETSKPTHVHPSMSDLDSSMSVYLCSTFIVYFIVIFDRTVYAVEALSLWPLLGE